MSKNVFFGRSVLVVDDEQFSRSIVVRLLRKLEVMNIHESADGLEALQALREIRNFDCVVSDFRMPKFNGLELLKEIRSGAAAVPNMLPFTMLTGHSDNTLVRAAMELDVSAFLVKPVSMETLQSRLTRMLTEPHEPGDPKKYRQILVPQATEDLPAKLAVLPAGPLTGAARMSPPADARFPFDQVPPDSTLSRDVLGSNGSVLLQAGAKLTPKLLAKLQDLRALETQAFEHLWVLR